MPIRKDNILGVLLVFFTNKTLDLPTKRSVYFLESDVVEKKGFGARLWESCGSSI